MAKGKKEIKEQLLVQSLGYLKLPKGVRDQEGNPKYFPNPDCTAERTNGKLVVTYTFSLDKKAKKGESK